MSEKMGAEDYALELQVGALSAQRVTGAAARLEAVLTYDHPGWTSPRAAGPRRYPGEGNRLARRIAAKGRPR